MTIKIPPELLHQWREESPWLAGLAANFIANKAVEWAADQQLIRVIDWLRANGPHEGVRNELSIARLDALATELWEAMRPKPPSLKEQALALVSRRAGNGCALMLNDDHAAIIRRALESLPG